MMTGRCTRKVAPTLIATQERIRGSGSIAEAYEAWVAGPIGEIRAYAATALIARIIAPIPKMRITRFRL